MIFTVGYSNLDQDAFSAILGMHSIQTLIDIRSTPFSQRHPEYNRSNLAAFIESRGMKYLFAGDNLGGRPIDDSQYDEEGVVDYYLIRKTPNFQKGLAMLLETESKWNTAIMCAEEDPLHCHRGLMIAPELRETGVPLSHIRKGGQIESSREMETRAMKEAKLLKIAQAPTLFQDSETELFEQSVKILAKKHGYRKPPE